MKSKIFINFIIPISLDLPCVQIPEVSLQRDLTLCWESNWMLPSYSASTHTIKQYFYSNSVWYLKIVIYCILYKCIAYIYHLCKFHSEIIIPNNFLKHIIHYWCLCSSCYVAVFQVFLFLTVKIPLGQHSPAFFSSHFSYKNSWNIYCLFSLYLKEILYIEIKKSYIIYIYVSIYIIYAILKKIFFT